MNKNSEAAPRINLFIDVSIGELRDTLIAEFGEGALDECALALVLGLASANDPDRSAAQLEASCGLSTATTRLYLAVLVQLGIVEPNCSLFSISNKGHSLLSKIGVEL
jgi:hypothetical protein